MIQINLLPDEFRVKHRTLPNVPTIKLAIAGGVLLVLLTTYFYIDFMIASSSLKKIEAEWDKISPEAVILQQLQGEVEGALKQEKEFLERFATSPQPLTSILQWVSEFLPENSWLIEIKMEQDSKGSHFLLRGLSLASKGRSSIESIEGYLHQLKEKMPDSRLSLTTTRETQEQIELTQFTALFDFGGAKPMP